MILVTAATGHVGRPLVYGLLAEGVQVRALTRNPAAAGFPAPVEVTDDTHAFQGIDAIFVNIAAVQDGLAELLTAAHAAGVRRVVMLSSIAVRDEGEQVMFLGRLHQQAEDAVTASGLDWTILRCGGFAANTLAWANSIRTEGVVRTAHGQAATALIAEDDIAAAAVRTLLDPGHAGRRYVLTGQESLTQAQQAATIGTVIGKPVRFEEISPETFKEYAVRRFPAPIVDDILHSQASYVGKPAFMTPDIEKLLGRPATSYAQWVAQHSDAFR